MNTIVGHKSFAMWDRGVFSKYKSDADFAERVKTGVSRRASSVLVKSFTETPRSIMWLVGWKGHYTECLSCAQLMPCPKCSKYENPNCRVCKGLGQIERGTGGYVIIDKETWTFARYIRMCRQPKHKYWRQSRKVKEKYCCKECNGHGRIPIGQVLGFAVPKAFLLHDRSFISISSAYGNEEWVKETIDDVLSALRPFDVEAEQVVAPVVRIKEAMIYRQPFLMTWRYWVPDALAQVTREEKANQLLEGLA